MPIEKLAYARVCINMVMRTMADIEDHSGLTFILIDLNNVDYGPIVQDIENYRGIVVFAPVDYMGAQIIMGEFIWAAFEREDLVMFTLKHAAEIRAGISHTELCETRALIAGVAEEINYPGLLTSLYNSPYGIQSFNLVFAIEEAAAWPKKNKLNKTL